MATLQRHRLFLFILLLHLLLATLYASRVPLGEAPDEPAHLSYARFIARQGRLPATLAEREEAGYRATWPPLYHSLVAIPLALVGEAPPTRLKAVGDTPRRLIPTNGQTIAAFIHTTEEAWPWQGLPLAWHGGRFISVLLVALAVLATYCLAWQVTGQRQLAAGTAAFLAFLPQALFIGGVISDDNLLILLSGLILLLVANYSRQPAFPPFRHFFLLGALLGLATVAKYNALPLWVLGGGWFIWTLNRLQPENGDQERFKFSRIKKGGYAGLALLGGASLTAGWWFAFIWRNFNQIESQGWLRGSLAALSAGTADASLRRLAGGEARFLLPAALAWGEWANTFFRSFWGLFGGGGTIAWPGWVYGLLALLCLLALSGWLLSGITPRKRDTSTTLSLPRWLFLVPLLFLALPLLRFSLSGGNIGETAQGRHLFPALPALALILTLGLARLTQIAGQLILPSHHAPRTTYYILPLTLLCLNLYSLILIPSRYPPAIPLQTTTRGLGDYQPVEARLAPEIELIGYTLAPTEAAVLPVTLLWQAKAIPAEDYLIQLTATGPAGQLWGEWVGHPLGGRYPTRAWDEGDILRDTLPLPLLTGVTPATATLTVTLLDSAWQPVGLPFSWAGSIQLGPDQPPISAHLPVPPAALRADGLAPTAPFNYRGTLSLVGPAQTPPPRLMAPDGRSFTPDRFSQGPERSLAHFIVAADWPGGNYQLVMNNEQMEINISNRPRQFEIPSMKHRLEANFAGHLTLLGYDLPQRRVEPGESFPLTLYLRAERPLGQNLILFNHLLDSQAIQYGGSDRVPKTLYTTLLWVPGEIVSDAYEVPVDPDAPNGIYWLDVGFYPDGKPHYSLPLFVEGQAIDRNSARIGPIKVGGPPRGLTVAEPDPQVPLHHVFGEKITLLGFDQGGEESEPAATSGQAGELRLFWQAETPLQADYTVFIHLLTPEGQVVAQADGPPAGGAYPSSLWEPGEIIIDHRSLPALPPGRYWLQVGLYQTGSGERLSVPGTPDNAVTLLELEIPG